MAIEPKPRWRIQFTLRDLLLVLGLMSVGVPLVTQALLERFERPVYYWPPAKAFPAHLQAHYIVAVVIGSILGTGLSLLWISRFNKRGARRAATLIIGIVLGWLGSVFYFVLPTLIPRSSMGGSSAPAAVGCKVYAEAQEIYYRTHKKYAESLHQMYDNGGYIDRDFADAEPINGHAIAKAGYIFRVLTAQGPSATGGKRNYITVDSEGHPTMTAGYAIMACPAMYDVSGRDTFIINNNGTIFQTDLGPNTPKLFETMTEFNPTPGIWTPAE